MMSDNTNANKDFVPPPSFDYDLPQQNRYADSISDKKKSTAIALAFVGGVFGLHDFYLGFNKRGKLKLKLWLFILPSIILPFWTLYDIIKMAFDEYRDGEGNIIR